MSIAGGPRRWSVLLIAAVAILGMVAGVLSAQEMTPAVYSVIVGAQGPANTDLTAYFPSFLQVHQGDTIAFVIGGFHNVRFGTELLPLVIVPEGDEPIPQINPAIAFPSSMEPGPVTFDGTNEVNSGLPLEPSGPFMVVVNAEPGVYSVFCDVHPGMVMAVEVVGSDVAIPSPEEAEAAGGQEIGALIGLGMEQFFTTFNAPQETTDTGVKVLAGQPGGSRAEIQLFFPFLTEISAGQSVTWEVPADHAGGHIVGWPPLYGQDVNPIPQDDGPPILAPGPAITQSGPADGETIGAGVDFNSGLLQPGMSYTLTFTDPGVYPYVCSVHPGMQGVVVVNSSVE